MSATTQQQTGWRRWAVAGTLFATLAGVAACDSLLEVELPDAVTESALENPETAALQVNSVMASVECAYSTYALTSAGFEDNFQRYSGVAGGYAFYEETYDGGQCDEDSYSNEWGDPLLLARSQGYDVYDRISNWTVQEVGSDREQLLAETALYNAVSLNVFGDHFCEFAIDGGPLMTPDDVLTEADGWIDTALGHIAATPMGDFAVQKEQGTIAESAEQMAYGLRARILWAMGDLSGANTAAGQVDDGFVAHVLREPGEDRRNMVSSMQGGGGGVQAAGHLQGVVKLKTNDNIYGISEIGDNPVTGAPWPDTIPFTGYRFLGIMPDGRALDHSTQRPVRWAEEQRDSNGDPVPLANGAVEDTRIQHALGNTAGGPDEIIQKYPNLDDDIPLVNWKEMRLIQAQYELEQGTAANAIGYINDVRDADGLPTISGTYLTQLAANPDQLEDAIIEERRRALWLEGRFWTTKTLNPGKLWFPRNVGQWVNQSATDQLNGGVRMLMPDDEYQINQNMTLADRGTGCPAAQAPVFN
ncbi:MAG: hypothetical protein R3223_01935 [Longimicrobiales bacterium]|nr:hypothetical protein [Longimicrobiales bacterium]